eukprot:scaffold197550_cov31-Tisochrysis_lutea.AAC.1
MPSAPAAAFSIFDVDVGPDTVKLRSPSTRCDSLAVPCEARCRSWVRNCADGTTAASTARKAFQMLMVRCSGEGKYGMASESYSWYGGSRKSNGHDNGDLGVKRTPYRGHKGITAIKEGARGQVQKHGGPPCWPTALLMQLRLGAREGELCRASEIGCRRLKGASYFVSTLVGLAYEQGYPGAQVARADLALHLEAPE